MMIRNLIHTLQVTPNSDIYFYQFTDPSTTNITWTTRFTIADASGNSVDPENATQPGGQAIPWGTGALVDPSKATPPPVRGTANGTSASASTGSTAGASSSVSSTSAAPVSSSSGITRVTSASASSRASQSTSSANATQTGTTGADSGADTLFVGQGLLLAMGTIVAALVL